MLSGLGEKEGKEMAVAEALSPGKKKKSQPTTFTYLDFNQVPWQRIWNETGLPSRGTDIYQVFPFEYLPGSNSFHCTNVSPRLFTDITVLG